MDTDKLMNTVTFRNGIPYRNCFMITEYCMLGDCSQIECHHCFPVKDCKKHNICLTEGTCKFIPIPTENKLENLTPHQSN